MVYDDELQQYVDSGVQATGSTSQSQIANIIQSMVVDYAESGNMSPITSNAVNVLVGNVEALMGSI